MIRSASLKAPSTSMTVPLKVVTGLPSGLTRRVSKAGVRSRPSCLPWRRLAMWKKSLACMSVEAKTPSLARMPMCLSDSELAMGMRF